MGSGVWVVVDEGKGVDVTVSVCVMIGSDIGEAVDRIATGAGSVRAGAGGTRDAKVGNEMDEKRAGRNLYPNPRADIKRTRNISHPYLRCGFFFSAARSPRFVCSSAVLISLLLVNELSETLLR